MASERSLYAKMRLVLEDADRQSTVDGKLADEILARGHPSFLTLQYDAGKDDYVWRPSRRAVLRAVNVAKRLSFLSEDGALTAVGESATRSERSFRRETAESLQRVLSDAGATARRLEEGSRNLLRQAPPRLPTARALWDLIGPDLSQGDFSRFLSLLADVGGATTEQRKVYTRFERVERTRQAR